jgi:hypothetical protein
VKSTTSIGGVMVGAILVLALASTAAADEPPDDWKRMKAMTPRGYVAEIAAPSGLRGMCVVGVTIV